MDFEESTKQGFLHDSGSKFTYSGRFVRWLDQTFDIQTRGSTIPQEIRAGLVTWVTMSYIAVVNPTILAPAVPFHVACRATCFSAFVASAFVGLKANLPFGMAAGMGLNSYFRYSVVGAVGGGIGLSPSAALASCFMQAVLFAALALSGLADFLQDIIPGSLKSAITVAIGVFQAFVGFQLMGMVVPNSNTLVALGDATRPSMWLALTAIILVAVLLVRRMPGALLVGIIFTATASHLLGITEEVAPGFVPVTSPMNADIGRESSPGLSFDAMWEQPRDFWSSTLCFLFIVLFDTGGVQHGIGQQAGLLDRDGKLPGAKAAYLGSALGTALGAVLGTSPVIIHNESAAGVQEGGRTGLCALTTAVLFAVSPLLLPFIEMIPSHATAPALVIVGAMMMTPVQGIDFTDLSIALPAFLTICVTPLTYSISTGIFVGISSYFVLKAVLLLTELAAGAGASANSTVFPDAKDVDIEAVARAAGDCGKAGPQLYKSDFSEQSMEIPMQPVQREEKGKPECTM